MDNLNFFSVVSAPTEVISATGAVISRATSFFFKRDEDWNYLVTNWHVVTGRDPMLPQSSKTGAVPRQLRLSLHKNVGVGQISHSQKVTRYVDINDETGDTPKWLEHPKHKYNVDIAVIKFPNDEDFKSNVTCHYLAEYKSFQEDFSPSVMNDVFVVGYPWGLTGGDNVLPLFKRGSVASEPIVDQRGLPCFLIDCQTARAMSGSPVLCAHRGLWRPPGGGFHNSIIGTVMNFAGVYSGRLKSKDPGENVRDVDRIPEIGIVWKKTALVEIVEQGVLGTKLNELEQ